MKTPEQMAEEYADDRCGNWEECENDNEWEEAKRGFLAGYKAAQEQVADVSKVMPQWISVKERLPEDGQVVLVIMPKGTVTLGGIHKKTQTWDVFLDMAIWTAEPTHWMLLPEPPKEEK